jgi:hypothetical protein
LFRIVLFGQCGFCGSGFRVWSEKTFEEQCPDLWSAVSMGTVIAIEPPAGALTVEERCERCSGDPDVLSMHCIKVELGIKVITFETVLWL